MTGCALAPPRRASGASRIAAAVVAATLIGTLPSAASPIDGTQVPEPTTTALVVLAAVAIVVRQIKKLRRARPVNLH